MLTRTLILAALFVALASPDARSDDGTLVTEAQLKRRAGKLKNQARAWLGQRQRTAGRCSRCKGSGSVRVSAGRRGMRTAPCPNCEGVGDVVIARRFRRVFYEDRTQAWRTQEGIQDRLEDQFKRIRKGLESLPDRKGYKIHEVEMVGETHGIVHYARPRTDSDWSQRWIFTADEGKSSRWYVYMEETDGAWPAPSTVDPEGAPTGTLLDAEKAMQVSLARTRTGIPWQRLQTPEREGTWVVLRLRPQASVTEEDVRRVGDVGVKLCRGLFEHLDWLEAVRVEWHVPMRDKFGQVAHHRMWTCSLERKTWSKIVWENLAAAEQSDLLAWAQDPHRDLKLWME